MLFLYVLGRAALILFFLIFTNVASAFVDGIGRATYFGKNVSDRISIILMVKS